MLKGARIMHKRSYYFINAITLYRLVAAFGLGALILTKQENIFKWFLTLSFFTDLIDGFLSRKFKVSSVFGSKVDSIADDLTVLAAIAGVLVFKSGFIEQVIIIVIIMGVLYLAQVLSALIKYGKITGFHTYTAKCAAFLQGSFFILVFFLPVVPVWLFYTAAIATILDLIEEIILVMILPQWKADVKGLYWVRKEQ
jgi:phosphatidylglycerophosphate synthase